MKDNIHFAGLFYHVLLKSLIPEVHKLKHVIQYYESVGNQHAANAQMRKLLYFIKINQGHNTLLYERQKAQSSRRSSQNAPLQKSPLSMCESTTPSPCSSPTRDSEDSEASIPSDLYEPVAKRAKNS